MCGIAGWVDYERDLRQQRPTVRTMAAALANRGPDGEAVWAGEHVLLGFRRLAVIDPAGGDQPMVAPEANGAVVLVYNGEVYNFRRVRERLEAWGHRFRTRSDTEVVLRAYLEWGERCVEHLDGMFAFAVWDSRRQQLTLARDRLGVKPLHYAALGRGLVFGSEVKALLAHPLVEPAVDAEGLAELLGYISTPGHAVYRGIQEVPPASIVVFGRDGVARAQRYWALDGREHTDDAAETVDTVRTLLAEAVSAQLVSDVPLCTLLSGGVDSSAIAALAARAGDGVLRTFAVDFDGHADRFQVDSWHQDPDGPHAAAVARYVGTHHEVVLLRTEDMTDPVATAAALIAQDLPRPIPDMDRSLYLLLRAVRERSTVALSGEIADELFGGYKSFNDPSLRSAGNFPWVTMGFKVAANGMGTGLLSPDLLDRVDVPGYTAARYREAVAEVPVLDGEPEHDRLMRCITYLHLTRWLPLLLDRDDRLSMAVGLELRVPYCDHRLVEYAFGIPWSMKAANGVEKGLLRAAVADLLPAAVVWRRKSPFPVTQDPGYGQQLRAQLEEVAADPHAPVRPLLDLTKVRSLLDERRPVQSTGWGERRDVETVLQLDAWLRRYRVSLTY
jgi:asparagine synthase (glutamine-hydrolysing)